VREFVRRRWEVEPHRSTCLRYLRRLGFVRKRPKKRFTKADAAKREAFVRAFAALLAEARARGAKVFFVDEAHFRADGDLRALRVLRGTPALVDSSSPRWGEKASYYSAVCPETGEVETMELEGNSNAKTSAAFLARLRASQPGPLVVIWDNGPAHRGDPIREFLATPGLDLRIVPLPAYSPDFNADEAIWDWAREEVTANTCLGTKARVQEKMGGFFRRLAERTDEVKSRCRTTLQAQAEALLAQSTQSINLSLHADPIRASV
jgi:transposase